MYLDMLGLWVCWDSVPDPAKGNDSLWNPTITMLRIAFHLKVGRV